MKPGNLQAIHYIDTYEFTGKGLSPAGKKMAAQMAIILKDWLAEEELNLATISVQELCRRIDLSK